MTSRYGRELEFGLVPVPNAADLDVVRALARRADELGLDLIGIQDHRPGVLLRLVPDEPRVCDLSTILPS